MPDSGRQMLEKQGYEMETRIVLGSAKSEINCIAIGVRDMRTGAAASPSLYRSGSNGAAAARPWPFRTAAPSSPVPGTTRRKVRGHHVLPLLIRIIVSSESLPHRCRCLSKSSRVWPNSVREYSTLGGTSA